MSEATPRWQRAFGVAIAAIAIAAAAFAIGRFSAFDSTPAAEVPTSSSPEAGFARDMQVHHQQAVEMALIIYPKTSNEDLRALAYDMLTSQAVQLGQMQQWLIDWNLAAFSSAQPMQWMGNAAGHEAHGQAGLTREEINERMGMATKEQIDELAAASGVPADCQFLTLMIRHHEGAIDMVDAVLQLSTNRNVRDLADKMLQTQQNEITAMHVLQNSLACGS